MEEGFTEFEALDPCCQKEILSKRRAREVTKELQKDDRSTRRLDNLKRVFTPVSNNDCSCCKNPLADYYALSLLRSTQYCQPITTTSFQEQQENDNNNDSDDSDNDSLLDDFEDERKIELKVQIEKVNISKQIGYGIHQEDSIKHIDIHIKILPYIVIHLYQDTELDAYVDIALEKLSTQYYGTLFRRIHCRDIQLVKYIHTLLTSPSSALSSLSTTSNISDNIKQEFIQGNISSSLLFFLNHKLVYIHTDTTQYCTGTDPVREADLVRLLDAHHILSHLPTDELICNYNNLYNAYTNAASIDEVENEEVASYCGDPACDRRFPHEHIGAGKIGGAKIGVKGSTNSGSSGSGGGMLMGVMGPKDGALRADYFTRL